MSTLFFVVILMCLGVVLAWYVQNESKGADGELGFLAISPDTVDGVPENGDPRDRNRGAYNTKARAAPVATLERDDGKRAYKMMGERNSFLTREKSGYRTKARKPRYSVRKRGPRDRDDE